MKAIVPLQDCQLLIARGAGDARSQLVGREARLNTPKAGRFNGRKGTITSVMVGANDELLVLVMVTRLTPPIGDYLNSDVATRCYWPLGSVELTGLVEL